MSSAEYSFKLFKPIFAYRQTAWTLIRLEEQSDLGPHCLQKWLSKIKRRWQNRRQLLWLAVKELTLMLQYKSTSVVLLTFRINCWGKFGRTNCWGKFGRTTDGEAKSCERLKGVPRGSECRPRGYKTFFVLKSAEHEICPANKSQISNSCNFFLDRYSWAWTFLC